MESRDTLIEVVQSVGVLPVEDPRRASRRAALEALDYIHHHTTEAEDCDLRIAARLLAVIATINGPGNDRRH